MNPVLQVIAQRFAAPAPAPADDAPMIRTLAGSSALVFDSPHSGTSYPADFGFGCDLPQLRHAEDTHVDRLFEFAPAVGAAWVEALFPRSYLDVNRGLPEIDETLLDAPWPGPVETDDRALAKVRLGKGLVWRCTDDGLPIYRRKLSVPEVQARIERCWRPYHAALAEAITQAATRHGRCLHVNCHSMPSVASSHATDYPGLVHADFVVGDRDGSTASPHLSRRVCEHLRGLGYSVEHNHPYKGVEIIRRHSDPARHRHSLQLEINRRLYMDERTLAPHTGFGQLQADLRSLAEMLLHEEPD